ncbi:hypothetical protein [Tumebacillus flagellatus]|nr:hypothetical protein [Tumebacillus flagellatus]
MVVGLFVLVCVSVANSANGPRPRPLQPRRTKHDSFIVDNNFVDNSVNPGVDDDHVRHGGHHRHHDGHHHHHSWDFGGGHHHSGGFDGGGGDSGGGDSGGGSSD